jgi:hypothetical protein
MNNTTPRSGELGYFPCSCGSQLRPYWIQDGYGIPLCKVCTSCEAEKRKGYRADISENYDADEPIEPQD